MNGRRREIRFLPSAPWAAALQTVEDVVLERAENGGIWVLGSTPARRGDDLTLEVATGGLRLDVRVVHSEPVVVEGSVRHRLQLRILDPDAAAPPTADAPAQGAEKHGGDVRKKQY